MSTPEKSDTKADMGKGTLRDDELDNVTGGGGALYPGDPAQNLPNLGPINTKIPSGPPPLATLLSWFRLR